MMPFPTLTLVVLSVICWASFALAIVWHFARPAEPTPLMKGGAILGTVFGLLQLAEIVWRPAPSMTFKMVAVAFYVSALSLFCWALQTTRGYRLPVAFTPSRPAIVLADGPYQWIRHPFYTSYLLYWIAGVCATANWWMISSVIVMGALYWRAADQEEKEFQESDLRMDYRAYMGRSGRFFLKLRGC